MHFTPRVAALLLIAVAIFISSYPSQSIAQSFEPLEEITSSKPGKESSQEGDLSIPASAVSRPPQEERIQTIGGKLRRLDKLKNGQVVFLTARSMGSVDPKGYDQNNSKALMGIVISVLAQNKAIVGEEISALSFEFVQYIPSEVSGDKIVFRQVINGLPLEPSYLAVTKDGAASQLHLFTASTNNSQFNPDSWLSDSALSSLAVSAWREKFGDRSSEITSSSKKIVLDETTEIYKAVFEARFGPGIVQVDLETGEVLLVNGGFVGSSRQCERNSNVAAPSQNGDCNQMIGGQSQYTIFKIGSNCVVTGHPGCNSTPFAQLFAGITKTTNWVADEGSSAPASFDVLYHFVPASSIGITGGQFHLASGYPVLGFTSSLISKGQTRREDVAGHEAAHMWHQSRNTSWFPLAIGSSLGAAYIESIADVVRAFSTGNYVQYVNNSSFDRPLNPTPDLTWSNLSGDYYEDSRILSNLFIDIRNSVGTAKGNDVAIWMAENMNSSWDGNSGFTIADFRLALRECITNSSNCGLTSANANAVCNLWNTRSFPGTLCPPPVPDKPEPMVAWNTGSCGYSNTPSGYIYGSVFYFTWTNVSNETYYNFCNSSAPFGPYTCTKQYGANVTTTYPDLYVTNGTWYAATQACNESGCSELAGVGFTNTCSG